MHLHEQRWARVIGAVLTALLLVPAGATAATAGSGVWDVGFDPSAPDRVDLDLRWDPRTGDNLTAAEHVQRLRLVLPTEVAVMNPDDLTYVVRGATTFDDWSRWGTTDPRPVVDGVIELDTDAVTREIRRDGVGAPTRLLVIVSSQDPDVVGEGGSIELTIWVSLFMGWSAVSQDIQLQYPQSPEAVDQVLHFATDPAIAGFGSTLVLHATPGFWSGPAHLEVVAEDGNHQSTGGTVSPDGSRLTVTVPERWAPDIGGLEEVLVRPPSPAGEVVSIPVVQASDDPVAAYVTAVYADLFGRSPDPVGLRGWTGALRTGTPYGAVADGITYSREFRASLVTDAYLRFLGREPDAPGLANWVDAMDAGLHIQHMESGFLASPEYYAGAGASDEAWVRALYADVLGREPAAAEVQGWLPAVRSTGRTGVARQFLYSDEHLTSVVDGLYQWLLGRGLDPTGRRGWVAAIQRGVRTEAIIAGIIASPEYRGRVPVSS